MLWEKLFCSTKIQPLLLSAGTNGNSAPVWSPCALSVNWKKWEWYASTEEAVSETAKDNIKVSFLKRTCSAKKLFSEWFQPILKCSPGGLDPISSLKGYFLAKISVWLIPVLFLYNIEIIGNKAGERFETCWCHISQSRWIQKSLMFLCLCSHWYQCYDMLENEATLKLFCSW